MIFVRIDAQNVPQIPRRVGEMDYRASVGSGECRRTWCGWLWQGEHVSENGRVLGENSLVDAEFDATGDEYHGAVVVPEVFVSGSRGVVIILLLI